MADKQKEITKLLNNLNLGTSKIKLGDYIAELESKVAELQERIVVLESAGV